MLRMSVPCSWCPRANFGTPPPKTPPEDLPSNGGPGVVGWTYMKPAPPVIIMFFTSGRGSNLVVPFRMGACFQTP